MLPIGTSSFVSAGNETTSLQTLSGGAAGSKIRKCAIARDAMAARCLPSGSTMVTASERFFHPWGARNQAHDNETVVELKALRDVTQIIHGSRSSACCLVAKAPDRALAHLKVAAICGESLVANE